MPIILTEHPKTKANCIPHLANEYCFDLFTLFYCPYKEKHHFYSVISSNSFSNVSFGSYKTEVWTDKAIEIKEFSLSKEDVFNSVMISFIEFGVSITFRTDSSKYFDDPKKFFSRDTPVRTRNFEMFERSVNSNSKRLGKFKALETNVDVSLFKSSVYGYTINLLFRDKQTSSSTMGNQN